MKIQVLISTVLLLFSSIFTLYTKLQHGDIQQAVKSAYTMVVASTPSPNISGDISYNKQTKTTNCSAQNGLPDSSCTPGAIIQTATKEEICTSGYSKSVRFVPETEKNAVYQEYGIVSHMPGEYEVDHLISLELGGSNDIANLWPEPANPRPGFHEKDQVENYLHDQVCKGVLSLQEAQKEISTNWLSVYTSLPNTYYTIPPQQNQ